MAQRHNEFAQLLGTAENGTQLPMANVPHFSELASRLRGAADYIAQDLGSVADQLDTCGELQDNFSNLQDSQASEGGAYG